MIIGSLKKIKKEINIKLNENETTSYESLWDIMKASLKGKFIELSAYIKTSK